MNTKRYKVGDYIRVISDSSAHSYVGKITDVDMYSNYYPYRTFLKGYSPPSQSFAEGSITLISKIEYLLNQRVYK